MGQWANSADRGNHNCYLFLFVLIFHCHVVSRMIGLLSAIFYRSHTGAGPTLLCTSRHHQTMCAEASAGYVCTAASKCERRIVFVQLQPVRLEAQLSVAQVELLDHPSQPLACFQPQTLSVEPPKRTWQTHAAMRQRRIDLEKIRCL